MTSELEGQISMMDVLLPELQITGCSKCVCRSCLNWWSNRCPYGECFDEHRSKLNPYDLAHPDKPPRTGWSNWKNDQAFWCRGGTTYPAKKCSYYIEYKGSTVKSCLKCNVQIFQDGYIGCSIIDTYGCARCYQEFENNL